MRVSHPPPCLHSCVFSRFMMFYVHRNFFQFLGTGEGRRGRGGGWGVGVAGTYTVTQLSAV